MEKEDLLKRFVERINEEIDDALDGFGDFSAMEFREEEKEGIVASASNYLLQVASAVYQEGDLNSEQLEYNFGLSSKTAAKMVAHISTTTSSLKTAMPEQKYAFECLVYIFTKFDREFIGKVNKEKRQLAKQINEGREG